jgi:hypothetical protein
VLQLSEILTCSICMDIMTVLASKNREIYVEALFVLDFPIPENKFIVNEVPLSFKELRNYVKKGHKASRYEFPETNWRYQDLIKGKLGGLKNSIIRVRKEGIE